MSDRTSGIAAKINESSETAALTSLKLVAGCMKALELIVQSAAKNNDVFAAHFVSLSSAVLDGEEPVQTAEMELILGRLREVALFASEPKR